MNNLNNLINQHTQENNSVEDKLLELDVLMRQAYIQPQLNLSQKDVKKVESIIGDKNISSHKWYLVKWADGSEPTWEPIENVSRYTLQLYHLNKEAKEHNNSLTNPRDNAHLYLRTSTPRVNDGQVSIEVQKNDLIKYCKTHNVSIGSISLDEGTSARNMKNLEGLQIILDKIQPNDVLMVWDISRFSRNSLQALHLLEELSKKKIHTFFLQENVAYNSAMNKHYIRQALSTAQLYSDSISERVKGTIEYKKSQGNHVGTTKFGYATKKVNGIRKLVKSKKEQNTIKLIKDICKEYQKSYNVDKMKSYNYDDVAKLLNNSGINFRGRPFNKKNINMLTKR
jgi:DNA invertase Pin-like site-specific DNA recombinase